MNLKDLSDRGMFDERTTISVQGQALINAVNRNCRVDLFVSKWFCFYRLSTYDGFV